MPSSIPAIQDQNATEGDNVTLWCRVSGMPPSMVSWVTPNGQRHSGKMLEVTSINRSQAGEYKCEASNECGNATKTARIHVQLKLPGTRNLSIVQYILYLYSNGFIVSYHINESVLEIILFAMFFMMAMAIFLPRDNSSLCDSTLICYWYALARFYWFISILIIIWTIRCYSLIGRLCN